jgi:lysophospholipase L1-like esterase
MTRLSGVTSPRSRRLSSAPSLRAALIGVAALGTLTGCLGDSGTDSSGAEVPRPAVDVTGDPAAISGAASGTADDAAAIDTVVMIGDSITKGATAALDERYTLLGLDHLIEAENGKRIAVSASENPSGASIARFLSENGDGDHSDEVWVVALGTNDVGQYGSPDEIAAAVNDVLAAVPDDAALVWVDTYFRDRPEAADELNAIVRERVTRRGDSVIAPWATFAPSEGVLTGDGVHPTPDGADVFAFVVTDTVRAFLGR